LYNKLLLTKGSTSTFYKKKEKTSLDQLDMGN